MSTHFMRSEFDFIKSIKSLVDAQGGPESAGSLGIGDDCAVLPKDPETDQLLTVDMLVEDIDFRLRWATPEDIGHKSLAVSLSDIAAMGGTPRYSLLSLGLPSRLWNTDFAERFMASYNSLATATGIQLIGGDISKTPEHVVVDSIVTGEVPRGGSVLRSGARVGDAVFVTGSLGGARAGLELIERQGLGSLSAEASLADLVRRILRPNARFGCGGSLRKTGAVTSMLDISDGLIGDLRHICEASGVGIMLESESIPVDDGVKEALARGLLQAPPIAGADAGQSYALLGGEDFELAFTVPASSADEFPRELDGVRITRIGVVTPERGTISITADGGKTVLDASGFVHF